MSAKLLVIARWLIDNPQLYSRVLSAFEQFQSAESLVDKARALLALATIVIDAVDSFPGFDVFGSADDEANAQEALESQAAKLNIDWKKLLEIVQVLLPIILPLFIDDEKDPA